MRFLWYARACALIAVILLAAAGDRGAQALPPAGTDVLPVVAIVGASTLLGEESVALTGWGRTERSDPRLENGVEVVGLELVELELRGASRLGAISVSERPNDGGRYVSSGEIRSLQAGEQFPASSFLDLFVDVEMPDGPFGSLLLHNETPLRLTASQGGGAAPLAGWPPLGVTYGLPPLAGEEPPCIPLLDAEGTPGKLDFCVTGLSLEIAPEWPSYSVARGGPSRLHPADILALTPNEASPSFQAPFVRISCLALGLTADGCDDGTDGDQDDLDALSYGGDLPAGEEPQVSFSVGPGAQGVPGSAVETQRDCPPAQPGISPEPEPDEFSSTLDSTNELVLDGNGPVGACAPAFPLGFVEGATVRDDLDALYRLDSSAVDTHADGLPDLPVDGVPDLPVYYSLDAASPSLATFGFSPADVLRSVSLRTPAVYASAAALGLQEEDDLDALCLRESGDDVYGEDDVLFFSLAPGSPTLSQIGAGPGDVLAPGAPPTIAQSAGSLGLLAADDVNALKCRLSPRPAGPGGDVDCDGRTNSIDAALVLQLDAGLIGSLPCGDDADVNEDGTANGLDAGLILQFEAGLIARLPPPGP